MTFIDDLETLKVTKKTTILSEGSICKNSYFVVSGCLKSFIIDKSGKEHILQFTPENWMVTDLDSFINQATSKTYIEAIEDSELKLLPKSFFDNIQALDKHQLFEQNKKLISNIIAVNKRLASILGATAEERYLEFNETYPTLIQRLPQKLIASYIGITPEYLSEIRSKLSKYQTNLIS